jgi:phage/plasmid-like protein (TIGR03299 family)
MSHEIDATLGRPAFAYVNDAPWWDTEGFKGTRMQPDATREEWIADSGLTYKVQRAKVRYAPGPQASNDPEQYREYPGKYVLVRNDSYAPLAIASDQFDLSFQPRNAADFAWHWVDLAAGTMETMGAIFGGAQCFAQIRIGANTQILPGDEVYPFIYVGTGFDGKTKTRARVTAQRVVCRNTQLMMLHGHTPVEYTQSHKAPFNVQRARGVIEAGLASFGAYCEQARMLTRVKIDSAKAQDMTAQVLDFDRTDEKAKTPRGFDLILSLFDGAQRGGSIVGVKGTAWGWLQAVGEYADHHKRTQSVENRFDDALTGAGADLKDQALSIALATL